MWELRGVRWGRCELGAMTAPDIKPSGCYERGADMSPLRCKKLSGNKVVLVYQWPVNLGTALRSTIWNNKG